MKTPPFLLAAALLFWGWQTDLLIFAVAMAAVLEGSRLIPFKWDFSLSELERVGDFCSLIFIGMLIYLFVTQSAIEIVFFLIQWLPFVFFLLLASQCYSTSGMIDIRALFLTLRRKRGPIRQDPIAIDLSYPYVLLCIIAAGAANVRTDWFYLGLFVLAAWSLWSIRSRRYSVVVWFVVLLIAGIGGYAGHIQLHQLQRYLEQNITVLRLFTGLQQDTDPYQSVTAIGDVGTVKLSNQTIFRVKSETGEQPPLLFREASYNVYHSLSWFAARSEFSSLTPERDGTTWKLPSGNDTPSQKGITHPYPSQEGNNTLLQGENTERVTVSFYLKEGKGVLKLPTGTSQLEHLRVPILTLNQFGTLKVNEGPRLLTYQTVFTLDGTGDNSPYDQDLFIPKDERPVIQQLAEELQLSSKSVDEILQTLLAFFQENFSYSLDLQRQVQDVTPLTNFLLYSQSGHCEYFATATVLLLRSAGIPTRYAVGYSVDALDKEGEWILVRGRDAHAWTLFCMNGVWHDFDTTPPSWRLIEEAAASPFEWISDLWSAGMFVFSEWWWREREWKITKYLGWAVIPLFLFLFWRLYSKKRIKRVKKDEDHSAEVNHNPGVDSEFYLIEEKLSELGFVRYPWESFSDWMQRIETNLAKVPNLRKVSPLHPILSLHYRYRFDPKGLTSTERKALKSYVQSWLEQCGTNVLTDEKKSLDGSKGK